MKTGEHLAQGKPEDKRKKSLTLIVGQQTDYFPIFGKPSHYMVHHLFKFGNKSVFGTGYAKTERHRGISPRHCAGFLNHRTTQGPYAAWPSVFRTQATLPLSAIQLTKCLLISSSVFRLKTLVWR